jgi:hypothetical protein
MWPLSVSPVLLLVSFCSHHPTSTAALWLSSPPQDAMANPVPIDAAPSQTITLDPVETPQTDRPPATVLKLVLQPRAKSKKSLTWDEGTAIDNEHMNKRSSKSMLFAWPNINQSIELLAWLTRYVMC